MKKAILIGSICAITLGTATNSMYVDAKKKEYKTTKQSSQIEVKSVDYDLDSGDKGFDIDFSQRVQYKKNSKVLVKDSKGKSYKAFFEDRDSDDCEINVKGLKAGKEYTITIKGIKSVTSKKFETVTITAKIPSLNELLKVKEVDYDMEDGELDIEFSTKVTYMKPQVFISNVSDDNSITLVDDEDNDDVDLDDVELNDVEEDADFDDIDKDYVDKNTIIATDTTEYSASIMKKEKKECKIYVEGLKEGNTYQYKITGIKAKGASKPTTITGTFTVGYDD